MAAESHRLNAVLKPSSSIENKAKLMEKRLSIIQSALFKIPNKSAMASTDKPRIVIEIAFPQTARLAQKTEEPFQTGPLHPRGSLWFYTGMEVEGCPNTDHHSRNKTALAINPTFLAWAAQSYK